jgi:hypothetical protein
VRNTARGGLCEGRVEARRADHAAAHPAPLPRRPSLGHCQWQALPLAQASVAHAPSRGNAHHIQFIWSVWQLQGRAWQAEEWGASGAHGATSRSHGLSPFRHVQSADTRPCESSSQMPHIATVHMPGGGDAGTTSVDGFPSAPHATPLLPSGASATRSDVPQAAVASTPSRKAEPGQSSA